MKPDKNEGPIRLVLADVDEGISNRGLGRAEELST